MPQRILIVDSSKMVRRVLGQRLAGPDRLVVTAGSSNQALAKLIRESFDLISTALDLPDESGLAFILAVRRLPGYASTPIIVVSGSTLDMQASVRQLGISAVINKKDGIAALTNALMLRCTQEARTASLMS
ncbi:MAG: PleD family two-component system response regulator [Thiotrichales bacterium]